MLHYLQIHRLDTISIGQSIDCAGDLELFNGNLSLSTEGWKNSFTSSSQALQMNFMVEIILGKMLPCKFVDCATQSIDWPNF